MSNSQSANAAAWAIHADVLRAAELEFRLLASAPPAAPAGWDLLLARANEGWERLLGDADLIVAIRALRNRLYLAPSVDARGEPNWQEALATSLFAARIAGAIDAPVGDACVAGLMHRAGAALAIQAIGRAEQLAGAALDRGVRSRVILGAEPNLTAALLTAWRLPEPIGAVVSHWRRYGAAGGHANDCKPVYFGHALAVDALHPEFRSPGLLEALAAVTGLERTQVAALRTRGLRLRELLLALG